VRLVEKFLALTRCFLGLIALGAAALILYHLAILMLPYPLVKGQLVQVLAALALGVVGTWLLDGRGRR
jgi:hypothetical protein